MGNYMAFRVSRLYFTTLKNYYSSYILQYLIFIWYLSSISETLRNNTHGQKVKVKVSVKSGFFPLFSLHCLCFCVTTKQDLSSLTAGTGSAGVRNVPKREHVYKRKALPPLGLTSVWNYFPLFLHTAFRLKSRPYALLLPFFSFFFGCKNVFEPTAYVIIVT